jgi:alpha-D-xyloside xylohydrolase
MATKRIVVRLVFLAILSVVPAAAQSSNAVLQVQKRPDGIVCTTPSGALKLQFATENAVRVIFSPSGKFPERSEYALLVKQPMKITYEVQEAEREITVSTSKLSVVVSRRDALVTFRDANGRRLFGENSRFFTPHEVNGEKTFHAELASSTWGTTEAYYGLGQHQAGVWNYRGESVDISQDNTNISIPFLVSSRGWGMLWNNASTSRFNNRLVHWLYISSDVADTIDYFFIYGPEFDQIIASYRQLTGVPPLFGKWAYGFWQSKNRYKSQAEILDVARKYRQLHLPIDNIVQDWFWWTKMGSHEFNKNYPDPQGMVDELHRENYHVMISVWPDFEPGSRNYDELVSHGWTVNKGPDFLYSRSSRLYDATNPSARAFYWSAMKKSLFDIGFDAWWLDTTEPETIGREENVMTRNQLFIGNGARYANIFPLMTTQAVYEGQRAATSDKRVFILTRSAFTGSQRNAAAAWSGDIHPTWETLRRQIPAGLNFMLSGQPYWTTDIGGFTDVDTRNPAYRELFVRWFEYGAFCPIFRTHGTRINDENELWSYGEQAEPILARYDTLRYRLLPYIYSLAWRITNEGYTMMRPLVMDFRRDELADNIGDQFLFGPALLVNPVTEPGAADRRLYLPDAKWYDFWTGKVLAGGHTITAPAPLDRMPLYVRAGSIVPMGPKLEYAAQKPADPIELRVYGGADADFVLYEDEGDNYNYEKGAYAVIPIHWNDTAGTLTIGDRKGSFPAMLQKRSFQVIWVGEDHGVGVESEAPDKEVEYAGRAVMVSHEH